MAPPHERYQCADHPLVFGFTTISISGDPQAGGADGCGGLSLQKWGGGGGGEAGRMAPWPESGGGGMWKAGRGLEATADGE